MRYSKSSILSFALAVAFSGSVFSGAADAQTQVTDFPWRAKAKPNSVAKAVQSFSQKVQSAVSAPQSIKTEVESVAAAVPSPHQLPDFFYDQGKKYIRQGDVYVESSAIGHLGSAATTAVNRGNFESAIPNDAQKQSMFDKAKSLSTRLNPFNKILSRNDSAYKSKNWDVPSFSKSLSFLDKKPEDPITFAAATPLPAKTAMPSAIDGGAPLYASRDNPAIRSAVAAGVDRFTSALPTETSITPAVASSTPAAVNDFSPGQSFVPAARGEVSVFDSKPATKTDRTASLSADDQFWSPQR